MIRFAGMVGTIQDIRFFVAVYEERSFTRAATRENATQSGVSQHVRKLEELLGVQLLRREKGDVQPTPAGDRYYRHCVELLRLHQQAAAVAAGHRGGFSGAVVVGLMPTMTRAALAPSLLRFRDENPNVTVRVVEGYSAALTPQVRAGELDFAVVPAFAGATGLRCRPILRTPEMLVAAAATGRQPLRQVRIADAGRLRLVVPSTANTRRLLIEAYLAANGVRDVEYLEMDTMFGALDFVARTDWQTILPAVMLKPEDQVAYTLRRIAAPDFDLELVAIEPSRRPLSPAASAFLDIIVAQSQRMVRVWTQPDRGPSGDVHQNSEQDQGCLVERGSE